MGATVYILRDFNHCKHEESFPGIQHNPNTDLDISQMVQSNLNPVYFYRQQPKGAQV